MLDDVGGPDLRRDGAGVIVPGTSWKYRWRRSMRKSFLVGSGKVAMAQEGS
jgi:hypothetical protein